jgi:hypothetical protein
MVPSALRPRPPAAAAGVLCAALALTLAAGARQDAAGGFAADVLPFLERHCFDCHGPEKRKGDLLLSGLRDEAAVAAVPETWALVRELVAEDEMPPRSRARPGADERERFLAWGAAGAAASPEGPLDPGRPVLRRLNHTEYRNAVRDLFGVDFPAEEHFPAEALGHGFDNQGEALSLPGHLLEKYLLAAETIAAAAFVTEDPDALPARSYGEGELEAMSFQAGAAYLYAFGDAATEHDFPRRGRYRVRVQAWGLQAGPDPCRIALRVGDRELARFEVPAVQGAPQVLEHEFETAGGIQRVAARFLNDYYQPDAPDPAQRDRNLAVDWIEVSGPLDPAPVPRFQAELLERFGPELGARREREILAHLARRVWRRPPQPSELRRLAALAPADAPLPARLAAAAEALLASPHFLFRFEFDEPRSAGEVRPLDDWELATRLSFFLWSTTPPDSLLFLAEQGVLRDPAVYRRQVERMLDHPRARALAEGFAAQWLQLRRLEDHSVDPEAFPAFDEELRRAMREEVLLLFDRVLREDLPLGTLLDAEEGYLNQRLAEHYGVPGVEGPEMRLVSLAATPRRGLLGQAGFLTSTSNPTRTSPVKRGKWITEVLLGAPPAAPPPGTAPLDESEEAAAAATLRERFEQHRRDPACAVCHDALDPLGFGLENFDATGAWREVDEHGFPVDAGGELPGGAAFSGPQELAGILRRDPAFLRALSEKLYVYALGRGLERSDRAVLEAVRALLDPERPTLRQLILAIVESPAFLQRRSGR